MSNQKDNSGKTRLDELLNAGKTGHSSFDDFEKDALEGFAMLESNEKILEAKAELDAKIYPALFSKKETKRSLIIWYAAAGLFLMTGFGIYLINKSELKEQPVLAQTRVAPETKKPDSEPTVLSHTAADLSPEKSSENLIPSSEFNHDLNLTKQKAQKEAGSVAKSGHPIKTITSEVYAESKSSKSEDMANDDAKKLDENTTVVKSIQANEDIVAAPASPQLSSGSNAPPIQTNPAPANVPSTESSDFAIGEIDVTKKSLQKRAREAVAASKKKTPATGLVKCGYLGGDEAFTKELGALLVKEKLDKEMSGTLVISTNKEVSQVRILKSGFNKKELKKVEQLLKTLNGFNIPQSLDKGQLFEYTFNYRPMPN